MDYGAVILVLHAAFNFDPDAMIFQRLGILPQADSEAGYASWKEDEERSTGNWFYSVTVE
jgi:hypothetical protein